MLKIYNVKRNSAGLSSLCFVILNCTRYILAIQKRSDEEIQNHQQQKLKSVSNLTEIIKKTQFIVGLQADLHERTELPELYRSHVFPPRCPSVFLVADDTTYLIARVLT